MKPLQCFLAVALIPIVYGAAVDVEKTIQQVEKILKENSQLPRLNREEILGLLNDIRAEDEKSGSREQSVEFSKEFSTKPSPFNSEIKIDKITEEPDIKENIVDFKENSRFATLPPKSVEITTTKVPSVMVVLPYTPKDGSSLLELYTKPPRVELLPARNSSPKLITPTKKIEEKLKTNAIIANTLKQNIPADVQEFLNSFGLIEKKGKDNFLLPLEGFKPLPPARVVDGSVQLPENILLAYDLIAPSSEIKSGGGRKNSPLHNQFLFDPLSPEMPFELQMSSSDNKEVSIPYDMPKSRKTKSSTTTPKPNLEPIDYDTFKVIPLNLGPLPLEIENVTSGNEVNKRQTDTKETTTKDTTTKETTTKETTTKETTTKETTTKETTTKETTTTEASSSAAPTTTESSNIKIDLRDTAAANSESGASIADLEDSFGGAAPMDPGDSQLPPPKKNGFYWMLDWNSFLEVGDGDRKVNIRLEPKLGDPQMFLPVNVP